MTTKGQTSNQPRRYLPDRWEVIAAFNSGWDTKAMADHWGCTEAYCHNRLAEMDHTPITKRGAQVA